MGWESSKGSLANGEGTTFGGQLLSGLSLSVPPLKGNIPGAWHLHTAPGRQEHPNCALTVSIEMSRAPATVACL